MNAEKFTLKRNKRVALWQRIAVWAFLVIVIALIYLPIALVIVYSFTDTKYLTWDGFSLELYRQLFESERYMKAIFNTFIIALAASVLSVILGTLAAVGVYVWRRIPKRVFMGLNQIPIINADIVTAVSIMLFFMLIGVSQWFGTLGKEAGGYAMLITAHTFICAPYVFLAVLPRLSSINPNLYEAALDLGAKPMRALWSVLIPQLIPSMLSGFLLAFTLSLDDFIITALNNNFTVETISIIIFSSRKGPQPMFKALSALIFVVVIIILLIVNIIQIRNSKRAQKEKVK